MSAIGNSLELALRTQLPRILGAIAILIIGWIVAVLVRAAIRRVLGVVQLNRRIADTTEQKLDLESGIATAVFWLIILITLIGVFNSLDLALASGPFEVMVKEVAVYVPHLVAGTVLLLVAWIAAVALRGIVNRVLDASGSGREAFRRRPACGRCARAWATCSIGSSFCCSSRRFSTPTTSAACSIRSGSWWPRPSQCCPTCSPRSSSASSAGCSAKCSPG